jgi:universal stress protein A
MNIKNVIVPVDFSPTSRLAVDHGVFLARKFRARLTLLHVVESLSPLAGSFMIETTGVEKEQEEQALRMLSSLLGSEDQDDLDLRVDIRNGDIKDEIPAAIRDEKADLVVMGTHGRGLLARLLIGSITETLLRKLPVPVLTVSGVAHPRGFKRILFATDLSKHSETAFHFVLDFARAMGSELIIHHAVTPLSRLSGGGEALPDLSRLDGDEAKARVAALAREAALEHVKVETAVVEADTAADAILKTAEEKLAELILIAVEKKSLVDRALLGRTAERVIRAAKAPVLSVPVGVTATREEMASARPERRVSKD